MNFLNGKVEDGKLVTEEDEDNVVDIAPIVKDVASLEGKEVVFAFRPEGIKLVKDGEDAPEGYKFTAMVELTELLGDVTNVYANIDGKNVILKVNPHDTPARGSECTFVVPYKAAYLYDKETELAVESDIVRH